MCGNSMQGRVKFDGKEKCTLCEKCTQGKDEEEKFHWLFVFHICMRIFKEEKKRSDRRARKIREGLTGELHGKKIEKNERGECSIEDENESTDDFRPEFIGFLTSLCIEC